MEDTNNPIQLIHFSDPHETISWINRQQFRSDQLISITGHDRTVTVIYRRDSNFPVRLAMVHVSRELDVEGKCVVGLALGFNFFTRDRLNQSKVT
jgi:hypothetical protein